MTDKGSNVLLLSTGNFARAILGEAILNQSGKGPFGAFGNRPPAAIDRRTLQNHLIRLGSMDVSTNSPAGK